MDKDCHNRVCKVDFAFPKVCHFEYDELFLLGHNVSQDAITITTNLLVKYLLLFVSTHYYLFEFSLFFVSVMFRYTEYQINDPVSCFDSCLFC